MPSYSTGMEKGHYGNAADHGADANSPGSSFSLDFAGMLDAADSALHQQICEYLQGPGLQQSDHQHFLSSSQSQAPASAPGFQGQALYPAPVSSFAALPPFQTSMPGESLQGTNFVQQRMVPDTSLSHLSRRDGNSDFRRIKGSVKAPIGSSAMGSIPMLPTGMGSCSSLPAHQQMYSTDVFHPPPQPNLVFTTREFSGFDTSCSPNNQDGPYDSAKDGRKAQKIEPGKELLKSQRPAEQAEHIIRERQRRDDMTSKFLMLESLLPPGPKRDRSTVVEDSIQYVKSLHHRVKALHEKRSEMKSNTISSQTTDNLKQKAKTTLTSSDPKQTPSTGLGKEVSNPVTFVRSSAASKDNIASSPSESNALEKTGSIDKIEVHLDLPHQIVIEMTCRPHRHIQSQIMAALERLGTDVSRCSIAKLQNRLICVLVVKPRVMSDPQITGDDVIGALKRAIVPD